MVDDQGPIRKNLSKHEFFIKSQIKRQQKSVKQLVWVGELSSGICLNGSKDLQQ
jgi:hypothetical protein